jgi:cell division protein FtsB
MDGQTPENKDRRNWRYAFLFLVLLVLALLVMEFNNRLNDLYRLEGEKENVTLRLEEQEGTRSALLTAIDDASSDQAVEAYARQRGKMKKPGDHSLVIVPGTETTPTPLMAPTPVVDSQTNPQRWLDLLFKPLR